jgi:MFS family permease
VTLALAGLVLAAAGTAPLFPTLLSVVSRNVAEPARGRATSIVTVVSYLGFLLGPVYVGLWASASGVRRGGPRPGPGRPDPPLLALSRYSVRPDPRHRDAAGIP